MAYFRPNWASFTVLCNATLSVQCSHIFPLVAGPALVSLRIVVGLLVLVSCLMPSTSGAEFDVIPGSRNELSGILMPYYLLIKDSFAKKINNKQLVKSLAKQKFKSFIGKGLEKLCAKSPHNQMCQKASSNFFTHTFHFILGLLFSH